MSASSFLPNIKFIFIAHLKQHTVDQRQINKAQDIMGTGLQNFSHSGRKWDGSLKMVNKGIKNSKVANWSATTCAALVLPCLPLPLDRFDSVKELCLVLHTAAKPLLSASAWARLDQYAAEASEEKLSKALKRKKSSLINTEGHHLSLSSSLLVDLVENRTRHDQMCRLLEFFLDPVFIVSNTLKNWPVFLWNGTL